MRKGKEILEELTDTEQLAFKINYLNERPDIKDYLKQEFPDRLTFYSEAFKWHSSKEGRFYWVAWSFCLTELPSRFCAPASSHDLQRRDERKSRRK